MGRGNIKVKNYNQRKNPIVKLCVKLELERVKNFLQQCENKNYFDYHQSRSSNFCEFLTSFIVEIYTHIFRFFVSSNLPSPSKNKLVRLLLLNIEKETGIFFKSLIKVFGLCYKSGSIRKGLLWFQIQYHKNKMDLK